MKINANTITRWIIYLIGMAILTFGITLSTGVGLGVSPIVSVAYAVSEILHISMGNMTMIWYSIFVVAEIIIHLALKKGMKQYLMDACQIGVSLIVTRLMNLYLLFIPNFKTDFPDSFWGNMGGRGILLFAAIVLTGVGAAMSINMRLYPNPGDGIVAALSEIIKKSVGTTKNIFDLGCVCLTLLVSYLMIGKTVGIGVGTFIAMICVGRVIAITNKLTKKQMLKAAGLS